MHKIVVQKKMLQCLALCIQLHVVASATGSAGSSSKRALWTLGNETVGHLPSCELKDEFCVSRCHHLNKKVTSCCAKGTWRMNVKIETCPDTPCDMVDHSERDKATCLPGFPDVDFRPGLGARPHKLACHPDMHKFSPPAATEMPDNLRVIFMGDGDIGKTSSAAVIAKASAWKPDFVVYNADLDYRDCAGGDPQVCLRPFQCHECTPPSN
jgi:hypothetical protein